MGVIHALTWALLALFVVLQVGDWWTTKRNLAAGGEEEMALAGGLIARFGIDLGFAIKGAGYTAAVAGVAIGFPYLVPKPAWAPVPWVVMADALYLFACWRNWRGGK